MTGAIRLRFVAEYGLLSWLICWFSHSRYAHVGVLIENGRRDVELGARLFVDEAYDGHGGLRVRPADYARCRRVLTVRIETTEAQAEKFHRLLRGQIGARYDVWAIISFALGRSLEFKTRCFDCSAAVAWALIHAGIIHRPKLAKRRFTPGDVLLAVTAAYPVIVEEST